MKRFLYLLSLLFLSVGLYGQDYTIPQVFSPNAAELGKYGKIPVSYFNGLPNISIPLTELKAKDYTLPVYLTYHAGGNKPEQHPGWVGLGWTLHAGGCINRIINGFKDEMGYLEFNYTFAGGNISWNGANTEPGYYYRSNYTQGTNWENESTFVNQFQYSNSSIPYLWGDYAPDEFQVNIDDINASFYFTGDNEVKIVSRGADDFTVEVRINTDEDNYGNNGGTLVVYEDTDNGLDLKARLFHFIDRIILTKSDGTKYFFGGDISSIEFNITKLSPSNAGWDAMGIANTWMLTKIVRPNGEEVTFTYEHDGVPIVRHDSHRVERSYPYVNTDADIDTFMYPAIHWTYSYSFLLPCYLKKIESSISQDYISFLRETSVELTDPYRNDEFLLAIGNNHQGYPNTEAFSPSFMWAQNYYKRLQRVLCKSGRRIEFNYSNTQTQRLHLGSVSISYLDDTTPAEYKMTYDPRPLPAYGSKMVDAWGYYNGRVFGQTPQDTVNINNKRTIIDETLLHAEMLTRLTYPTGGYTTFEYGPHTYGKYVHQFPFEVRQVSSGFAGGLRVSKITNYDGEQYEERSFDYTDNGVSSGILSGEPKFRVTGVLRSNHVVGTLWGGFANEPVVNTYVIYREDPLFQLSSTDGNHVTYSRVKETRNDGSWTEYRYSNHDTPGCLDTLPVIRYESVTDLVINDVFISKALRRGQLVSKKEYTGSNDLKREETNTYAFDNSDYIKSINRTSRLKGACERFSYLKIYSCFPYLAHQQIKTYFDGGSYVVETTDYEYDSHRNLTKKTRTSGGHTEIQKITYPEDIAGGIYPSMAEAHFLDRPVERLMVRDGKVISSSLTTYKSVSGNYLPDEHYQFAAGTNTLFSDYNYYNGQTIGPKYNREMTVSQYDSHGNPLLIVDKNEVPTTFAWDSKGYKLNAVFEGSINGSHTYYVRGAVPHTETSEYVDADPATKTFSCEVGGMFSFSFTPADTSALLSAKLDGNNVTIGRIGNGAQGTVAPVSIASGIHTLDIYCNLQGPLLRDGGQIAEVGNRFVPIETYPISGTLCLTYPVEGAVPQGGTGTDCFFNDFESTGGTYGYGFQSNCGRTTPYTISVLMVPNHPYILDYMQKVGDKWQYVRELVTPITRPYTRLITASSSSPIDHVRFYPADNSVTSYTWTYHGKLRCKVDADGRVEIYEYDPLGRLISISDGTGNKLKKYTYHYIADNNE